MMKTSVTAVVIIILIMLAACGCGRAAPTAGGAVQSVAELLSLGEKYLLELDYEQAVVCFTRVIEIEPMNPRGYTGAADAYVGLGRSADAIAILEKGLHELPGDTQLQGMLDDIRPSEPEGENGLQTGSGAIYDQAVLTAYSYTDFSYSFNWGEDQINPNSLGWCVMKLTVSGAVESIGHMLISNWKEEAYSDGDIMQEASRMTPIWKREGIAGREFSGELQLSRPVHKQELGKTIHVLLLVLDEDTDAIGHIVLTTETPLECS